MKALKSSLVTTLARMDALETGLCIRCNRLSHSEGVRLGFAAISRLGDGVFWYCLMLALPLMHGQAGLQVSVLMAGAGLSGLLLYKFLKTRLLRERPFVSSLGIRCGTPPLDRYSFPSGHTLHAVLFTTIALAYFPLLAPVLIPFMLLVAVSRVVLGLHYPSDVVAGAALGWFLAESAIQLAGGR